MNKPYPGRARPLAAFVGKCLADTFAQRGFAATEIVTHWPDIAGPDIAIHCEPIKIEWPRRRDTANTDTATLVLRVEGGEDRHGLSQEWWCMCHGPSWYPRAPVGVQWTR